jgi:hypothetical protein
MKERDAERWVLPGLGLIGILAVATPARADGPQSKGDGPQEVGVLQAAAESLTGDVYAEPSRWRPLSLETLFSEGWNQPWASPPTGAGGAPRQGWLDAADGVFYRLAIGTFAYKHGPAVMATPTTAEQPCMLRSAGASSCSSMFRSSPHCKVSAVARATPALATSR